MGLAADQAHHATSGGASSAQLRTVVCRGGVSLERDVALDEIAEHLSDPDDVVWTDVRRPEAAELDALTELFGIDPGPLEDLQRSRLHEFKTHVLLTGHALRASGEEGGELEVEPVALFIGKNFLVTVQPGDGPAIGADATARWLAGGAAVGKGVAFAVATVFDAILATYLPAIERIDERLDTAEIEIFASFGSHDVQDLLHLKREVTGLRRVLNPLQDNLKAVLRPDHRLVWPELREALHETHGEVLRVLEQLESEREMVTTTLEASFSVASNQLNRTMKSLALVTVILAVASSVFGAWGMNFESVPLARSPWGFWAVIGITLVLVAMTAFVGRRR
jgi:magnesium transporter